MGLDDPRVDLAICGDLDALSALLREHGPVIGSQLQIDPAWRAVLDPLDVMQVTYMEAFLRIRSFDPARGVSFATWLRVIAENNLRDAIRSLKRRKRPPPTAQLRVESDADSRIGLLNLLADDGASPSAEVRRDEMIVQVENAVAALPERYAQVVRLYDLEGHPIEAVMQKTGRSAGAVYMLRARALERLREMLGSASQCTV